MIYLDPTAIMKLISTTPESPALTDYLRSRTDTIWFTCALSRADESHVSWVAPGALGRGYDTPSDHFDVVSDGHFGKRITQLMSRQPPTLPAASPSRFGLTPSARRPQ